MSFTISRIISAKVPILVTSILFLLLSCQAKQENAAHVDTSTGQKDETEHLADEYNENTPKKLIVFFGNSLTAGYGLDEQDAFPALIQKRIDSLGLPYLVVNAGLSGETSSGGNSRVDWILKEIPEIFVLELGANDMLRGLDLTETEKNLKGILEKVKAKNPTAKLVIAGMQSAANMGPEYATKFNAIYKTLAKEFNASLIPFLLENVATKSELNLGDGKHPNAKGQKIVMENVWKVLNPLLKAD